MGRARAKRHTLASRFPATAATVVVSAGTTLFIYANAEPKREGGADIKTRNLGPSLTAKNLPSRLCHYGAAAAAAAAADQVLALERKGSLHQ